MRRALAGIGVALVAVIGHRGDGVGQPGHAAERGLQLVPSRELAPPVADAVRDRGTVLLEHQDDTWGEEEAGLVAELLAHGASRCT